MTLEILEPGLSTTVQDRGRFGHYNVGIPQGGSMDQLSAEIVNALVGNSLEEAVLECTYLGPKFRTSEPAVIAVGGAPVEVKVNGATAPQWEAIELAAGDEVSFGFLQGGTRYYVGNPRRHRRAPGARQPLHLRAWRAGRLSGAQARRRGRGPGRRHRFRGSPRWNRPGAAAGVSGRNGHQGPVGPLRPPADQVGAGDPAGFDLDPHPGGRQDRPALQRAGVEWKAREQPFGAGSDPSNIVDAGYAVGSIQIPGGNEPIVLHRDAVSGGGYAMVATVISADMDQLARSAPAPRRGSSR